MPEMSWLPRTRDWTQRLDAQTRAARPSWNDLTGLAGESLDFLQVSRLDKRLNALLEAGGLDVPPAARIRVALLGSSTVDHMLPGLRIAALRWRLWADVYVPPYAQYFQELADPHSGLHAFAPQVLICALDPWHLLGTQEVVLSAQAAQAQVDAVVQRLRGLWRQLRQAFDAQIIQPTLLPLWPALMGSNEQRHPGSGVELMRRINAELRVAADAEGVDLLALDDACMRDGLSAWHDRRLWLRAKQYVAPTAAHMFGELAARLMAARRGTTAKCLVLDLDNTLWGGVIGDDGLEHIVLGQGSADGEAFVAFQRYVRDLSRRGVILAVCSKNDLENARLPFEKHPEMVLKTSDVACFVANWQDKAGNLRLIAQQLNIGLDALAFADDNPFERDLVRRELPMVRVLELPEDPALYVDCVASSGFFEAVAFTEDDRARTDQYQANQQREALRVSQSDLGTYLASLEMVLEWSHFNETDLARIVQLVNKTNQFNLTTRRHNEADVRRMMADPRAVLLHFRLRDRFGDNGIIGVVAALPDPQQAGDWRIDTWLMSCRVLGREVERATLAILAHEARAAGARRLVGEYVPTVKNAMVSGLYEKLGFTRLPGEEGKTEWRLDLENFQPGAVPMQTRSVK